MLVALLSDSHDHTYNFNQAIAEVKKRGIETVLFLGDFCAPGFVKKNIEPHQDLMFYCIWGNVDGARAKIVLMQRNNKKFDIVEEQFRELEIGNRKVFMTHFEEIGEPVAKSGDYDAVFYGDTHTPLVKTIENGTLVVNPGEIAGFKTGKVSFAVWDTEKNTAEIVFIEDVKLSF